MSATVHIDELNPATRAKVLKQIGEPAGTTALATVVQETCMTPPLHTQLSDDQLADIVIEGVRKIRQYLPHIIALKARFEHGDRDGANRLKVAIKDCRSWKEFCNRHLDRSPEAIRQALAQDPTSDPNAIPTTCQHCGELFSSKGQCKRHAKSAHPEIVDASRRLPQPKPMQASENVRICVQSQAASLLENTQQTQPVPKVAEEIHWISKANHCPTGKRGFDYPDDIWQLMRAEGSIGETDFIAYIGKCGQCGRCHRDKDQSGHKEGTDPSLMRHQTWYRPNELNEENSEDAVPYGAVFSALNKMLPYHGDGVEHVFITNMEAILAAPCPTRRNNIQVLELIGSVLDHLAIQCLKDAAQIQKLLNEVPK